MIRFDKLSVDHNHLNKQIRELLCQKCNHGIGLFNENSLALRAAANYIEKWNSPQGK